MTSFRPIVSLLATTFLVARCLQAAPKSEEQNPQPRIKPPAIHAEAATAPPLDLDWPKRIALTDPGSQGDSWAKADFDDGAWQSMNLPGHFEGAGLPDYDGVVWFRKTFELTADQAKAAATLLLGQIDDMDVTWVNGLRVGGYETPGHHYTPRKYLVPSGVLKAGKNIIAVRVMDHGWQGGIAGKPEELALQLGDRRLSLANAWRFAAGANLDQLKEGVMQGASTRSRSIPIFEQGFGLEEGDVVAFMGGSIMVKQMESAALEVLLTHAAGKRSVYFRDLAWQADTVYLRQRPRNFGSQAAMLERINASVVIASFGQMEALEGGEKLDDFIAAYEQLLDELQGRTKKIVLVTPYPFASADPLLPDLTRHNPAISAYAEAIVKLAKRRNYLVVDLSQFATSGLTQGGVQLTAEGHARWAAQVARQLLGEPAAIPPGNAEALRAKIEAKNLLWKRYWRPTNWAFLYGNRQHVPSSQDHRPGQGRWFPKEINGIVPLIEEAERQILLTRSGEGQ